MIFDLLYLLLLLTGIIILVENRLTRQVLVCAIQGFLLCGSVFQVHDFREFHFWTLISLILIFKTFLTPYILFTTLKRLRLHEHTTPRFGYFVTLLLFIPGLLAVLKISNSMKELPVNIDKVGLIYVLLLIYLGILTFVARRHWVVLIIGFVMFENGLFLLTLILNKGLPFGTEFISFVDALLVIVAAVSLQTSVDFYKTTPKENR
jgi:hydrogenase-4 component E